MSSEWQQVHLQDIATEVTVGYVGPMASEYVESGIPFLRSLNIELFNINKNDLKYIRQDFHARIKKSALKPHDVVIVRTGKPGTCAVIPNWLEDANCSDLVIVRCGERIRPRFLCYWVNSAALHHIDSHTVGAVQQHFNVGAAKKMRVAVPSLAEQDSVVSVLGALDDRITLLRETNATLESIARALFKSWFVDFDPVRAKQDGRAPQGMDDATAALFPNGFEVSELGLVPRGWRIMALADVLANHGGTIQTGPFGSQLHASDYVESGIPVVMPKDIQGRRVSAASIACIGPQDADRLQRHKLKTGDIVFSRRGDVERHALISEREVGWLCGTGCLLVRPGPSCLSSSFLSMTLDAPRARQWLVRHAIGATMPNLNTSILGSVPVVLPDTKVLEIFEETVSATEAQLTQNSELANTLSSIRDTLLPRLISGQLRLSEAEALVA
ncbi:restriction endonuclease subunit S [Paraburkholderia sediminicola]|uniref:Restriction endonuclease subunit S n=1 Tax=Paraburkholderia rhynchosiae TaxID=487049 RepID=A0ACC7NI22_9BURK